MKRMRDIVSLALVCVLTGIGFVLPAQAQQRPYRVRDAQIRTYINNIERGTDRFRLSLDRALNQSRSGVYQSADNIREFVDDFEQATDQLRERFNSRQSTSNDVEFVLQAGAQINSFIMNNRLPAQTQNNWTFVRSNLDNLARAYNVDWDWNSSVSVPDRFNDQEVRQLLARIESSADEFRRSLEVAMDRSPWDGRRAEDNITRFVTDFETATDRLQQRFNNRQAAAADVQDVLTRAARIDQFMMRRQLEADAEADWLTLRGELDELAQAYNVAWNWNNQRNTYPNTGRNNDYGNNNPRNNRNDDYRVGGRNRAINVLTGTYRLEANRSDNPRTVVDRATRNLSLRERQRVAQILTNRLAAPEQIAIDRQGRSITIASSRGARITIEADGQARREQVSSGRSMDMEAQLVGDQLTITTTTVPSDPDSDFTVTFDPTPDGRAMRVTRRVYHSSLNQPVQVLSYYTKTSEQAQFDVYASTDAGISSGTNNEYIVPNGQQLVVVLNNSLSTEQAREGDRFTATVRSPAQYDGAVIEGYVASVNPSGRVKGRAELALNFQQIRMPDGRTYKFAGFIETVRLPDGETVRVNEEGQVRDKTSQTERTVQRGAIGAAIGAIIGAIAGGGSGAAIGAAVGAGVGAGSVVVEGRDQLELNVGTEMTVTSSAPTR